MRVLIVEDESRLARNIAQVLKESANFAVDVCTEGVDGLHMAKTNSYDLIVLDLMLPGMDGLDILSKLRSVGKSVQKYIFDRFYRIRRARGEVSTGSGLGLALAQEIAQKHHGSITVQSDSKSGTDFVVTLAQL